MKSLGKHKFDCSHCKLSWNCGFNCQCDVKSDAPVPLHIRIAVNISRDKAGITLHDFSNTKVIGE